LSDAAKAAQTQGRFDIVLIADGGDTCDADICSTAVALKEKSQSLRIHVIGFNDKPDELKPLTCVAGATGGTFVAATNAAELKQGLATVLDAIVTPGAPPPQVVAAEETAAMPAMAPALPAGVATAQPIDLDAQYPAQAGPQAVATGDGGLYLQDCCRKPIDLGIRRRTNLICRRCAAGGETPCTSRVVSPGRLSPGPHPPPRRKRLPSISSNPCRSLRRRPRPPPRSRRRLRRKFSSPSP
jgi:hypothetical protein